MKISSILRDLLAFRAGHADMDEAAWADDPYAHPDIDAMSERERADLPAVHMPAPGLRGEIQSRVSGNRFATCA